MATVFVNGQLVEESAAVLSVFDHGLVVGDGVFETILIWRGRPFALGRHLDRLARSAGGLRIACPPREELEAAVREVVAASGLDQGRLRITVTAGRGPLGSGRLGGPPSVVVAAAPLGEAHEDARVAIVPWTRNESGALAGLKTTSYAENVLALAEAERRGADEAVFANTRGMLCEGTGSNLFYVLDGRLLTPPLSSGCLAGVTRALVLEHGLAAEADLPIERLARAEVEEAFLTSTLRGVQPISAVDGHSLGAPGPLSKQAQAMYAELLEAGEER